MDDFRAKSYGRNQEVAEILAEFDAGRNVSMPGPRRLGKTFLLDRLVDAAEQKGWTAVKVEVAGCSDSRAFFRALCGAIGKKRSGGSRAIDWIKQRFGQLFDPQHDPGGPWWRPLLTTDYETHFSRLMMALNDDAERRWALLIDELPIFLKALHDKGPEGIAAALNFMNLTSRLRAENPKVRWMITGSIGLEPLARSGNYMGVLAKFHTFELQPLDYSQAQDFVKDLATSGRLVHRNVITDVEAQAITDAVGWRAAYYLEAVAKKLRGSPSNDAAQATSLIEQALKDLLQPAESGTFGVWEEHLRKHYRDADRTRAFAVLAALAPHPQGLMLDTLLTNLNQAHLTKATLRTLLTRLHVEGFASIDDWDSENPIVVFRNPLLRRWWERFEPQAVE